MVYNNLLVISNNYPNQDNSYAAEIFVKDQIKYLKNHFDNVYVISPVAHGMERLRGRQFVDYQYENVKVYFPKYFNLPFTYFYGRHLWRMLEMNAIKALIQHEKLSFTLIHAHFTWPSGAVAVDLKDTYKVPVIITEHTSNSFNKAIKYHDPHWINTWTKADAIIRVKKGDINIIETAGVLKNNIAHIPNGFDLKFSSDDMKKCRELLNLPKNKKILLNVGNPYGVVKGHRYLIEAMSDIVKNRKDIHCVIVGDGKLSTALNHQIHSLGLEDYVILAGAKPHNEIPLWMNACDIFVLPSLNEGNPTVMFEALGCGKPFVGTKVGGVPEIITSDDYGLLVEPADPKELAEKIQIALDRTWNTEVILKYAQEFTWENISKEILKVYAKTLQNHGNKP